MTSAKSLVDEMKIAWRVTFALLTLSVLSVAILLLDMVVFDETEYKFMLWNLFLAWVPYPAAFVVFWQSTKSSDGQSPQSNLLFFILIGFWLLFFPNATYLLTDIEHVPAASTCLDLSSITAMQTLACWFDVLMLFSFALNGVLLGFVSLYMIEHVLAIKYSHKTAVWWCRGFLFLSAFGIYLGRVVRLNSWDVLHPFKLIQKVVSYCLENLSECLAFTLVFFVFFLVTYAIFRTILKLNQIRLPKRD